MKEEKNITKMVMEIASKATPRQFLCNYRRLTKAMETKNEARE